MDWEWKTAESNCEEYIEEQWKDQSCGKRPWNTWVTISRNSPGGADGSLSGWGKVLSLPQWRPHSLREGMHRKWQQPGGCCGLAWTCSPGIEGQESFHWGLSIKNKGDLQPQTWTLSEFLEKKAGTSKKKTGRASGDQREGCAFKKCCCV